jgi:hypothetical protein
MYIHCAECIELALVQSNVKWSFKVKFSPVFGFSFGIYKIKSALTVRPLMVLILLFNSFVMFKN